MAKSGHEILHDEMERWLREEVIPAYEELRADPSIGISIDQVRVELARRRKRRKCSCPEHK